MHPVTLRNSTGFPGGGSVTGTALMSTALLLPRQLVAGTMPHALTAGMNASVGYQGPGGNDWGAENSSSSDNTTLLPPQGTQSSIELNLSLGEAIAFSILMSLCICTTIVGNILVIISVFTYRPLKNVQNFFIVSLAVADLAVAILVMPFNVVDFVIGRWVFGAIWCNMWLTFDILTCTASILNLCVIAIDRYYAIHDPIRYATKRTQKRVLGTIIVVWLASALISAPPLIGWNNSGGNSLYVPEQQSCRLTNEKGFVVYSASGSFFIPLFIMSFVYVNIFRATRRRLRARAKAAAAARLKSSTGAATVTAVTAITNKKPAKPPGDLSSSESPEHTAYNVAPPSEPETTTPPGVTTVSQENGAPAKKDMTLLCVAGKTNTHAHPLQKNTDVHKPLVPKLPSPCECDEDSGALSRANSFAGASPASPCRKKNRKKAKAAMAAAANNNAKPRFQVHKFWEEKQRISLSKERRAARTMAIIMGAFVLCWLPFFLMYVIFPFCPVCAENTDVRIINFIVWLGYVNSTLNPVIYTIFNIDFRRAFKIILQGKCRL